MKHLTKSDLINIEAFKGLLHMVSNDIKELKASSSAASEKADNILVLYLQRMQLINQASEKYNHINWLEVAIGPENSFERSVRDTARMKIEAKFNLN